MRAPLDTSTSDIVLVFLVCVLILGAVAILWDALTYRPCSDCGQRPKPRTGADLDAMEAHPGCCQDCAHRHARRVAAIRAALVCAPRGCSPTKRDGEWVCGRCNRPLAIERTPAS